jgi:endonuclease G, mitochondrial
MKQLLTLALCLVMTTAYAQTDTVTLKHTGYTSLYSKTLHYPLMVQWWVTKARVGCASPLPRKDAFGPDPLLKKETDLNNDYKGAGYDRGHMCPAADNECDGAAELAECFYFSNMVPQPHSENAGQWKNLETMTRDMALKLDSCYIWAGGIGNYKTFGKDKVVVPTKCWKVIYVRATKTWLAYIFDNTGIKEDLPKCKSTVAEVEKLTGFKFTAK